MILSLEDKLNHLASKKIDVRNQAKVLLPNLYTLHWYIRYATFAFTTYTAATVDFLPQWHTSLEQPPCPFKRIWPANMLYRVVILKLLLLF